MSNEVESRRNTLCKGKIEVRIKVTGRRGRRLEQLVGNLKETRG
jgi:hypothetical protein